MSSRPGPDQPLDPASVAQLVAVAMRLAMEVSALRERLLTHEALLARHGLLSGDAVEAYSPSAEEAARRSADARVLIQALAADIVPPPA